jgi:hypothetical protein
LSLPFVEVVENGSTASALIDGKITAPVDASIARTVNTARERARCVAKTVSSHSTRLGTREQLRCRRQRS